VVAGEVAGVDLELVGAVRDRRRVERMGEVDAVAAGPRRAARQGASPLGCLIVAPADAADGRNRRARDVALAAGLGAVLAVAMTWPLVLHLGRDIGKDLGDPLLQTWQVAWIGHALLHQPLQLFQANTFWPYDDTLAFSDALVGYAPAGLVAQAGPHAALVVYNLLFLFAYALAFAGTYLLARELGTGMLGGVAAGAAFAYAPWRLAQNGHLHVLSSGGIPLALFLLVRGYRRGSVPLVLGGWLVAAWQVTLGFTLGLQLAYLLAALGAIALAAVLRRRLRAPGRRVLAATGAGVALLGVVSALQARPYLRVVDAFPEARRTPAYVETFSPPLRSFLAAPAQSWLWADASFRARAPLAAPDEMTLFPGLAISLLALAGVLGSVYPRPLRLGLGAGVVLCALLSLGVRDVSGPEKYLTPFRILFDLAPGWDGVRTPGRLNTLTSLGLALLAGAGLGVAASGLTRRSPAFGPSAGRRAGAAAGTLAVGAILLEGLGPLAHPAVPPVPAGQRLAVAPQLHLPASFLDDLVYSYWSTEGFPATVNGAGGFDPIAYDRLRKTVRSFPDARSVAALRALGVRTVVLHPERGWEDVAARPTGGLPVVRTVAGGVVLYRLEPLAQPAGSVTARRAARARSPSASAP
jgi:hypothetical protein